MKYIASCSCGKDSLAMLKVIKDNPQKYPLDEIVICKVMATPQLSGNTPLQEQFIEKMIPRLETEYKVPVTVVKADFSFEETFYRKKEFGKRIGEIYGFPYTLGAWCNDRLKMKPLNRYFTTQGPLTQYVGIAYDEPKRAARLGVNKCAPLYEQKITEAEAKQICIENNMLSPIYQYFDRDGCWFCPKQSLKSLKVIYEQFPQLWERLKQWQADSPCSFRPDLSIFDLDERFKNGYIPKPRRKSA